MPEDPNACPIELLKKSGKKNRENIKSRKSGQRKDPPSKVNRKGVVEDKSSNSNSSVTVKPPYSKEHYEQLVKLCGIGATLSECASYFGISHNKLNDHCKRFYGYTFGDIYKQNKDKFVISVRRALYQKAVEEGYWPAIRYLANNLTEWSESPEKVDEGALDVIFTSIIGEGGDLIKNVEDATDLNSLETFDATKLLSQD